MSFYGAFYGAAAAAAEEDEEEVGTPIPVPVTHADPTYVDHAALMVARLPYQFKP